MTVVWFLQHAEVTTRRQRSRSLNVADQYDGVINTNTHIGHALRPLDPYIGGARCLFVDSPLSLKTSIITVKVEEESVCLRVGGVTVALRALSDMLCVNILPQKSFRNHTGGRGLGMHLESLS